MIAHVNVVGRHERPPNWWANQRRRPSAEDIEANYTRAKVPRPKFHQGEHVMVLRTPWKVSAKVSAKTVVYIVCDNEWHYKVPIEATRKASGWTYEGYQWRGLATALCHIEDMAVRCFLTKHLDGRLKV